jgi:hypothetical protein
MLRSDVASSVFPVEGTGESDHIARWRVLVPRTPVFDAVGLWVGVVDYAGVRASNLMIRPGRSAHERLPVPLATVVRSDPDAVYLNTYNTLPEARV